MDRINIGNIFSSNDPNFYNDKKNPLDVHSLYHSKENLEKKVDFNINRLMNMREERKKEVLQRYKKVLRICLKRVNEANNLNSTDIVYQVPTAIFGCADYNSNECLAYVEKKLRLLYLDTLILSNKSIFISWKNIGDNFNSAKKNKK